MAWISGKPEDWEAFKSEQRTTKKAIRGEKMKYECKLASNIKEDKKSFFQYIKGKRKAIGPLENEAGEVIIGNKAMAEELNSYFASRWKTPVGCQSLRRIRGHRRV